jgi:hypothetical protein
MENLKVEDELAKITRRLDSLQKQLDLLNNDRNIFEDIQGRLTALEEQWRLTRKNDNEVRKDIKEEINISGDRVVAAVETKVEELQPMVQDKKVSKRRHWYNFLRG